MNQNANNVYPGQWGDDDQQYPSNYSTTSYQTSAGQDIILTGYEGTNTRPDDELGYHATASVFSPSDSLPGGTPASYAGQGTAPLRQPPSSHLHLHSHHRSHSQVRQFVHQQPQSQSHNPQSRPRSHSQTPPYIVSDTSSMTIPQHPPSHYPSQVPFSPPISISSQFPATPSRPFACDLCALSFNRQHDLKRHRETHTGEKPYLCNGGCGKTFTRKDALKRHQLVKACGKVDDAWP